MTGASRWRFTPRGIAWRLFLTCWLIYALHFATNTVREIYLALAIGDHLSFRVDEYAGIHDDLFEKPGFGWHIGANPGASMLAAVPYGLFRPLTDRIVASVNRQRRLTRAEPPEYNSPWPRAREFFREAWRRGYDVKFALASFIMQAFCMALFSAAGAVVMFFILRRMAGADLPALLLALLYAFGTPVFFRTGYINQNMLAGHFGLAAFAALWLLPGRKWAAAAGAAAGMCVLLDYSGAVLLAGLFAYCILVRRVDALAFFLGSIPPVLLLWFYQWQSFGHPFLPGQHWMPPVEWIERGYQGVSGPQFELAYMLVLDHRFGLFLTCPLLLLALAVWRIPPSILPRRELVLLLLIPAGFWLFFSCVNYTRLQFNTGLRYMAPVIPLLFLPCAAALMSLPRASAYFIGVAAVAQAWAMAMFRDVERGLGVLDPVVRLLVGGFQLPALTTLSRVAGSHEILERGVSPLYLFAICAALLYGLWRRWE
jgi:hypothetical protein